MPRILIVDNSNYVTGAAKSIRTLTEAASDQHSFFWAITNDISDDDLRDLGNAALYRRFDFIEISKSLRALTLYLPRLLQNARKMNRMVREENIEIVHVNDCYNMVGVVLKLMNKRVKVLYHVRLLRTSYIGPLFSVYIKLVETFADAVVCCSQSVSSDVGPVKITKEVIYCSERFKNKRMPPRPTASTVRSIVYVGNIMPGKGQDLAIRAFALVHDQFPDAVLNFVGKFSFNGISTQFKETLDQLIIDAGLDQKIQFKGYKGDVQGEMKKADLALNLSESESFSMVCLEALKSGVPLIASDCGGPAELFEHMRSGWLVPNRNVTAAAEALRVLLADQEMRMAFSAEGRRYVEAKFDVKKEAEKITRLYDSLLA